MQQPRSSCGNTRRMAGKTVARSGGCGATRIQRPPPYFLGAFCSLHRLLLGGVCLFGIFLLASAQAATNPSRDKYPTTSSTSHGMGLSSGFQEPLALLEAARRPVAVVSDALDHGPRATTENEALLLPALITSDGDSGTGGIVDVTGGVRDGTEQHEKLSPHSVSRSLVSQESEEGVVRSGGGSRDGEKIVKFMLEGRVESYMVGDTMQGYLNGLVDTTMDNTKNQSCNIAFVKTHKTASTTMATILYRYGKRHGLNVANFEGHQTSINLSEAARKVQETGNPVDIMHYHHSWDGFYEGSWGQAKTAYLKIMRDPSDIKLVTVLREPVSHYLSYYYYFLQPETEISIAEYFKLSRKPSDPRYERIFLRKRNRKNNTTGWHGFKLLQNPLSAEFGIQNEQQLESFLQNDLPEFAMILLTEQFEESLAIFMRMFNWQPIDMTYCRVVETRADIPRYDGKMLVNVPKVKELAPEVINAIRRQTSLDLALYKAAVKIYQQHKIMFEDHLDADIQRIRTAQSAVHGYLDFSATSPAHKWYEGDVKCFANPSPMQPF